METKFYIDAEANNDEAYQTAMKFACELAKKDDNIKRIVLYIITKQNTGWFDRLYGNDTVKKMFNGNMFKGCPVPFKFETKLTYKKSQYNNSSDIVISCGMDADNVFELDDFSSVKYIIAVPWQRKLTEQWIKTWNAIEITGKKGIVENYPEPTCIVKKAMLSLTSTINMSTGISHPSDNNKAKTYILALSKYEQSLNADIVNSYLIKELGWFVRHAKDIKELIKTLNAGKFFKGGERKGLQNHYKRWKEECKK